MVLEPKGSREDALMVEPSVSAEPAAVVAPSLPAVPVAVPQTRGVVSAPESRPEVKVSAVPPKVQSEGAVQDPEAEIWGDSGAPAKVIHVGARLNPEDDNLGHVETGEVLHIGEIRDPDN